MKAREERSQSPAGEAEGAEARRRERAGRLVERGLAEAGAMGHPILRVRHQGAWAFRLSVLEPEAAAAWAERLRAEDPALALELLRAVVADRLRRGDATLEPHFSRAVELARAAETEARLQALNDLSEQAMALAERAPEAARALLRRLAPEARALELPDAAGTAPEGRRARALASALVGEALLVAGEAEAGGELLEEAARLAETLPGAEALLAFLAEAFAPFAPQRAAALVERIEEPAARFQARLRTAAAMTDSAAQARLLAAAEAEAAALPADAAPEAWARLGQAVAALDAGMARRFLERALAAAEGMEPQLRALHATAVAAAAAPVDRAWAGERFQEAAELARRCADPLQQVTTLALVANEMAESHPRAADALFREAMERGAALQAVWELAHVMDVVFHARRSPYLDLSPARALLERLLERLSDEDPRIPGVLGLPEVSRWMAEVDRARAVEVLRRWLGAARATGDFDGMLGAAIALHAHDPELGEEALRETRELLLQQIDCLMLGEFVRRAAPVAPELVLPVAPRIPDPRERAEAVAAVAAALVRQDPERALGLVETLERPADRSLALMEMADVLLDTGDRPRPRPLLEELP